ncbi:hypothetical protein ABTM36_20295, partial [Acinetobacter baumannii]
RPAGNFRLACKLLPIALKNLQKAYLHRAPILLDLGQGDVLACRRVLKMPARAIGTVSPASNL